MKIELYKKQVEENVVAAMLHFMSECEDCGYSDKDVKKCKCLLIKYLVKLGRLSNPTEKLIMKHVRNVVIGLNKLNKKTDYCLIETDEREAIWQIIQDSAVECGLDPTIADVTEEWRDW